MAKAFQVKRLNLNALKPPLLRGIGGVKNALDEALDRDRVVIMPPQDVQRTLELVRLLGYRFDTAMLDPWYNKGFGGTRDDYLPFFLDVIRRSERSRRLRW